MAVLRQDKTFTIPCRFDINIYHFSITVAAHSMTAAARWQQRGGCGGGGSATVQRRRQHGGGAAVVVKYQ